MSNEEILSLIRDCQTTLAERKTDPEKILYQDNDRGITVSVSEYVYSGNRFYVSRSIINRSDLSVEVSADDYTIYVNNWEIKDYNTPRSAEPGRNASGAFFYASGLDKNASVSSAADLSIVEGAYLIKIGDEKISVPFVITDFSSLS